MIKTTTIILLFLSLKIFSQPLFFEKKFGTALPDYSRSIVQLPSGTVYLLGNSASGNLGNTDVSLIRLDKYGNEEWTEYYGDENFNNGYCINKCSDGNLIFVADALISSSDKDILIYKVDTLGGIIWQYLYSTSLNESAQYIEETTDGGYVAAGFQTDTFGFNNSLVFKIDANGNFVWDKSFGGSDNDYASAIKQIPGGNLILTADTKSYGAGEYDVELTKMDANGNIIWQYTYGDSLNNGCQGIYVTSDNYLISFGETELYPASPYDMFVEKLDTNGVSIWKQYYGNISTTDACFSIAETFDLGYMLTGYSNSFNGGAPIDLAVIKIDSSGNQLWGRSYGGLGVDIGYQIIPSLDNGFYITGKYFDVEFSDDQYYLLHIDKDSGSVTTISDRFGKLLDLLVYPNPNNGNFYIKSTVKDMPVEIMIYSIEGKLILEKKIELSNSLISLNLLLSKGIYIVEIKSDEIIDRKKMIVE